jgi:hypothetical protein
MQRAMKQRHWTEQRDAVVTAYRVLEVPYLELSLATQKVEVMYLKIGQDPLRPHTFQSFAHNHLLIRLYMTDIVEKASLCKHRISQSVSQYQLQNCSCQRCNDLASLLHFPDWEGGGLLGPSPPLSPRYRPLVAVQTNAGLTSCCLFQLRTGRDLRGHTMPHHALLNVFINQDAR